MSEVIKQTDIQTETTDLRSQNGVEFDLGRLIRRYDFHETIGFLNAAKEKFEEINWQGGLDPKLDFLGIRNLVTDIYRGNTSSHFVTTNERLALAQAIVFAYKPREVKQEFVDFIEKLREKAQREKTARLASSWLQTAQELEEQLKGPKNKRWLRKAALVIPPLALVTVYTGNKLMNSYSDEGISDSQSRTSEISEEVSDGQLASNSPIRLPSFLSNIGESIQEVVNRIPLVEELNEEDDDQYTRWGFTFVLPEVSEGEEKDPSKFIIFEWQSDKVIEANGGILEAILYPQIDTGGRSFGWECLHTPDKDCSKAIDNFIIIGGHSGVVTNKKGELVELAMEPIRAFIEGHKLQYKLQEDGNYLLYYTDDTLAREEREQKMDLLEEERPSITQEEDNAKAQVAVVRIEEIDRDKVYNDWNRVVEIALKYEPNLGESINLQRGGLILAISGRRIAGDNLSGQNHYEYTSSLILIFVGEPAGS